MKVFLSWSGDKSRQVALALREWLPGVINSVEPFVSSKDIESGTRWQAEIAGELEDTGYGIICVTRDNQHAPWLNFEAGALAKAVKSSRVVPLAVDLKLSDIEAPLAQFQAQPASAEGLHEIVRSLNSSSKESLGIELLDKAFDKWWPDLSEALAAIQQSTPAPAGDDRKDRELIEETLDIVRRSCSKFSAVCRACASDLSRGTARRMGRKIQTKLSRRALSRCIAGRVACCR